jgi:hypothetical protein
MIEGTADGPQVHLVVIGLTLDEFWCQVQGCTNSSSLHDLSLHLVFAHTQISHLNHLLIGNENVQTFNVPVNNIILMQKLDGL